MKKSTAMRIIIVAMLVTTTARAEIADLKTHTGLSVGLSLSSYKYEEPGLMSLEGGKIGVDMRLAKMFPNDLSIRGELRHAYGELDYNSSGTGSASGNPDLYTEARFLVGKDWVINDAVISPYTGGGYRYLYHDGQGNTSTGNWGYRRESNYIYLPIGIIHRTALNDQARLVSTLEYDHLLIGKQISRLTDGGLAGSTDVTNTQSKGYGLKLSVNYEKDNWAIGPFAHYWNIAESDHVYCNDGIQAGWCMEPKNNTVELGFKGSKQF